MTTPLHRKSLGDRIAEEFSRIAFAEAGELYPEHPHKLRSVTDVFTEVTFAESQEEYRVDVEYTEPPKVCVNGETSSGVCV